MSLLVSRCPAPSSAKRLRTNCVFGAVPMKMKTPSHGTVSVCPLLTLRMAHALDAVLAVDALQDAVEPQGKLRVRAHRALINFLRAELLPAMDHHHLARELRDEQALLQRAVPAADDDDFLVPEERRITGRAIADAPTAEFRLAGHVQFHRVRAHRQDRPPARGTRLRRS